MGGAIPPLPTEDIVKYKIKIARTIPNEIKEGVRIVDESEYKRLIGQFGFISLVATIPDEVEDTYGAKVTVDGEELVYNETQDHWENEKGNKVGDKKAEAAEKALSEVKDDEDEDTE